MSEQINIISQSVPIDNKFNAVNIDNFDANNLALVRPNINEQSNNNLIYVNIKYKQPSDDTRFSNCFITTPIFTLSENVHESKFTINFDESDINNYKMFEYFNKLQKYFYDNRDNIRNLGNNRIGSLNNGIIFHNDMQTELQQSDKKITIKLGFRDNKLKISVYRIRNKQYAKVDVNNTDDLNKIFMTFPKVKLTLKLPYIWLKNCRINMLHGDYMWGIRFECVRIDIFENDNIPILLKDKTTEEVETNIFELVRKNKSNILLSNSKIIKSLKK